MVPFVRSLRTKVRKLREPRPASAMAFAAVAVDGTDTYVTRPRDRASLLASALIHFASWLFPSRGRPHTVTRSPQKTPAPLRYMENLILNASYCYARSTLLRPVNLNGIERSFHGESTAQLRAGISAFSPVC